jgi:hypothetical protein
VIDEPKYVPYVSYIMSNLAGQKECREMIRKHMIVKFYVNRIPRLEKGVKGQVISSLTCLIKDYFEIFDYQIIPCETEDLLLNLLQSELS